MQKKKINALSVSEEDRAALSPDTFEKLSRIEDLKAKQLDYSIRREELFGNRQDREERKRFADKLFCMLVVFLFSVISIVIFCAIDRILFNLSDTVIVALLTTCSANVVGVFLVVVRYLFKASTK